MTGKRRVRPAFIQRRYDVYMPTQEYPVVRSPGNKIAMTCGIFCDLTTDAQVVKKCPDVFDNFSSMPGWVFTPDSNKFRTYPADFHTGTFIWFFYDGDTYVLNRTASEASSYRLLRNS